MENSKIEWTDHTFNPWRGCAKIAAGCEHCYAATMAQRNPKVLGQWGPMGTRVVASEATWQQPLKWNRAAKRTGVRARVFCASLGDVFEDWDGAMSQSDGKQLWVSDSGNWTVAPGGLALGMSHVRSRLFRLIDSTPHLDWLLLTKRPENIHAMWPTFMTVFSAPGGGGWRKRTELDHERPAKHRTNVWLGTSVSNNADWEANIPALLKCRPLAPVLFASAEPLLASLDAFICGGMGHWETDDCECGAKFVQTFYEPTTWCVMCGRITQPRHVQSGLDWVIAGGESGPKARPTHPDWFYSLRDECVEAGVPFFFKQWGEWVGPGHEEFGRLSAKRILYIDQWGRVLDPPPADENADCITMVRVGRERAGRLLARREWNELPSPREEALS